jgi:hypothetical protein
MASGFSAIQNNSDVSQGLSPRLAAQSTTRAVGILMPLWSRSEQIKVQSPTLRIELERRHVCL